MSETNDPEAGNQVADDDDLEAEEQWLKDAGIWVKEWTLNSPDISISSAFNFGDLSQRHSATVRRRLRSMNEKLRQKYRRTHVVDDLDSIDNYSLTPSDHDGNGEDRRASDECRTSRCDVDGNEIEVEDVFPGSDNVPVCPESVASQQSQGESANQRLNLDSLLPTVLVKPKPFGITRIGDLDEGDMKPIRSLAYIEATSMFEDYNIDLKKRKRRKAPVAPAGGSSAASSDPNRSLDSDALIILRLLEVLKSDRCILCEGILRKPGSNARVSTLISRLEQCDTSIDFDDYLPHDLSTALKELLRPNPLLTRQKSLYFVKAMAVSNVKQQLHLLNLLLIALPEANQRVLRATLEFVHLVASNFESNKMTLNNVAVVFSPSLVGAENLDGENAGIVCEMTKLLINYHEPLWTIPPWCVNDLRRLHERDLMKNYQNNLKSKRKTLDQVTNNDDYDYNNPHINVSLSGSIYKLFVARDDTVAHCIDQIIIRIGDDAVASSEYYGGFVMYETGGNLIRRRLDPSAVVLEVMKQNPNASWNLEVAASSNAFTHHPTPPPPLSSPDFRF